MDSEILAGLDRIGFHVLETSLDSEATRSLIDACGVLAAATQTHAPSSTRIKRGVVFALRNLLSVDFVQQFISSAPVQHLIDRLCPGAAAVRAILFDKTGDANWTVPWHQDRSIAVRERIDVPGFGPWSKKAGVVHVQPPVELLRQMVTLRFSLDACGSENGPLRTIAGTHERILGESAVAAAVARGPESCCTAAAGGIVIMRPLVLHASSPAKCAGHRRVLHIEMGPPELPGGLRWARA